MSGDAVHHAPTPGLSAEQKARVDAVRVAREVTAQAGHPMSASWQVDVVDLISVAQFILTGQDPFEATEPDEIDEAVDLVTRLKARDIQGVRDGD